MINFDCIKMCNLLYIVPHCYVYASQNYCLELRKKGLMVNLPVLKVYSNDV